MLQDKNSYHVYVPLVPRSDYQNFQENSTDGCEGSDASNLYYNQVAESVLTTV